MLTWNYGKQLASFGDNTFVYDGYGRRIRKNDTVFTYDANNKLVKQSDGTNTLEYVYDNSGLSGVKHNDKEYIYSKDIQGNIIGILDKSGREVVQYRYDAWGNCKTIVLDEAHATIAELNPFRYRSYYYDTETNLYYLNTRYYDPEVGRFISQDDVSYLDPEHINGLNLFAYCGNNPVSYIDSDGQSPKWWQWLLFGIGAAVVVVAIVVLSIATAGVGTAAFGATLAGSIAVGAAKGALIGAAIGTAAGIVGGVAYSAVTGAEMSDGILQGFLMGFGIGAIVGAVVGGAVGGVQYANAVSQWGTAGGRTAEQNMIQHFKKHVINEGHKYLGKNVIQYTKNAKKFFTVNKSMMKLTKSGNYMIRALFAGHKVGGVFDAIGTIFSFF